MTEKSSRKSNTKCLL